MSVTVRPDGKYKIRVKHNGKETVRFRGTHWEALKLERELLNGHEPSSPCTLGDALQLAWDTRWKNQRDGKKNSYPRGRLLCEFFGYDMPITDIKPSDLNRYKDSMRHFSGSTLNRRISAFNVMWRCAAYEGLVSMADLPVVMHEKEPEGRLRWLFPKEEQSIYTFFLNTSAGEKLCDWMKVSIDTGLRTRESLVIQADHVSGYDLTVESKVELGEDEEDPDFFTKNAQSRVVKLTPRAHDILHRRSNMPFIFADLNYQTIKYHFDKAREWVFDGETEITPYITRHTCASRLVQGGMELPKIKKWMGHSSVKVTERYAKMSSRDIAEGANILSGFTS